MEQLKVNLSLFGNNLGSRNFGENVFEELKSEILIVEEVLLDFEGVRKMTLSFGTELIDSIDTLDKRIKIQNANPFIERLLNFCLNNIKPKNNLVLN